MTVNRTVHTRNIIICAMFSALIVVGTFIKIPIPIVPFTLQFLFTNLAGLTLGKKYGVVATSLYIAIGLLGLPVFTNGGGFGYIFQPTFGYILGFAAGSWAAGFIIERKKAPGIKTMLVAGFLNLAVVYAIGMVYYYMISKYYIGTPIGVGTLVIYCFLLAVPGDIVLCIISAILAKRLCPLVLKGGRI